MNECNYQIENPGKVFQINGVFGNSLLCENISCSYQGLQYPNFCGEGSPFGICGNENISLMGVVEVEKKNSLIRNIVQATIDYKQNSV
tara:strand:+ start:398 stop:661 length:264 start_codon:yes stop_codon:yes gene_type:complete